MAVNPPCHCVGAVAYITGKSEALTKVKESLT